MLDTFHLRETQHLFCNTLSFVNMAEHWNTKRMAVPNSQLPIYT